jgi:hypothetical protein
MVTRRQLAAALRVASLATLIATSAVEAAEDDGFGAAMQNYDECHYSIAYDRLAVLADGGHAEAARIALLMVRYGPQLYGGQWSASPYQIEHWIRLASSKPANVVTTAD